MAVVEKTHCDSCFNEIKNYRDVFIVQISNQEWSGAIQCEVCRECMKNPVVLDDIIDIDRKRSSED